MALQRLHGLAASGLPAFSGTGAACCAAANKQSLEVSYTHLSAALPILAVWTADVPKQMLEIYDRVVQQVRQAASPLRKLCAKNMGGIAAAHYTCVSTVARH